MIFKEFLSQLDEMSMKAGDLEADLKRIFDHYSKHAVGEGDHIGDIETVQIMRYRHGKSGVDFFVKNKERVGICVWNKFKIKLGEILEVDNIYIMPEERNKDLYYKYLYFLKNVNHEKILIGTVHSTPQRGFLKKMHNLKRFDVKWVNINTGETDEFEREKYESRPTDWRILIESDSVGHEAFERYHVPLDRFSEMQCSFFRNHYDWLFEGIEDL